MKKGLLLMGLVASSGLVCSCSGNYIKVLSVSYNNGTTLSSSTVKTIHLIASYKFANHQLSSSIKDFNETWYVCLDYHINIVTNKIVEDVVPPQPKAITVNLTDYNNVSTGSATLNLDKYCGEYESYTEAFIDTSTLNGKQIFHTYNSFSKAGEIVPPAKSLIYEAASSTTPDGEIIYTLSFHQTSESGMYVIQHSGDYFIQGQTEKFVKFSEKSENLSVSYNVWPY